MLLAFDRLDRNPHHCRATQVDRGELELPVAESGNNPAQMSALSASLSTNAARPKPIAVRCRASKSQALSLATTS